MLSGPASNPVLIGSYHASTELMQNAKGGFISRQPELPLKLHRRHALRLAGNQISRPEPYAERRVAALHHGANQKTGLAAAGSTRQDAGPRGDAERLRDNTAVRAGEAALPARLFKISGARLVVREKPLELRERFRERKVGAVENVHSSPISASCIHLVPGAGVRQADKAPSLDMGGVCVNRIGTVNSSVTLATSVSRAANDAAGDAKFASDTAKDLKTQIDRLAPSVDEIRQLRSQLEELTGKFRDLQNEVQRLEPAERR